MPQTRIQETIREKAMNAIIENFKKDLVERIAYMKEDNTDDLTRISEWKDAIEMRCVRIQATEDALRELNQK